MQLDKLCKIRLLQNQFAALQRGTPFGDAIFLLVKKDSRERHAKEPMVLWKLLHYAAYAFALTNRCQTYSHWCLARILISGGVPELRPICSTEGKCRSTP